MSETATTPNNKQLPEGLQAPVDRCVATLRETVGAAMKSLTVYGSATTGEFDPDVDAVRSVLVVDRVDLEALRNLSAHGQRLGRDGIAAPLIMTPAYIKESLDTFPLELIEIGRTGVTVVGEDHFADLSPEVDHVQLQCERELKVLLIGLRQGLLTAAGRERALAALAIEAGDALVRTMRGLLWLSGEREARTRSQVLAATEKHTGKKWPAIRLALEHKSGGEWDRFVALYDEVHKLSEIADAH